MINFQTVDFLFKLEEIRKMSLKGILLLYKATDDNCNDCLFYINNQHLHNYRKNAINARLHTHDDESTIDESPMAYKPMDYIVNSIRDTIDIIKVIKPVYNFKSSETIDE